MRASSDPNFGSYVVLAALGATALPVEGVSEMAPTEAGSYRHIRVIKTAPEWFFFAELIVRGER